MPRVTGVKERYDKIYYDTHNIEAGQKISFFKDVDLYRCLHNTDVVIAGQFLDATVIFSFGVRLMGLTRDQEDVLLDDLMVQPVIRDKVFGPFPGSVLSTLRYVNEDDEADPVKDPVFFLPGYVLLRPLLVSSRQTFRMDISASGNFPASLLVRAMVFTMHTRELQ